MATKVDVELLLYHRRAKGLTIPIPSRVLEKVKRMLTMGVNHAINLSSPLQNSSKACAWVRNISKTESGEVEFANAAAKGCVPRSCLVRVLYSFAAVSNIAVKLAMEGSVVWLLVDIGKTEVEKWGAQPSSGLVDRGLSAAQV